MTNPDDRQGPSSKLDTTLELFGGADLDAFIQAAVKKLLCCTILQSRAWTLDRNLTELLALAREDAGPLCRADIDPEIRHRIAAVFAFVDKAADNLEAGQARLDELHAYWVKAQADRVAAETDGAR